MSIQKTFFIYRDSKNLMIFQIFTKHKTESVSKGCLTPNQATRVDNLCCPVDIPPPTQVAVMVKIPTNIPMFLPASMVSSCNNKMWKKGKIYQL